MPRQTTWVLWTWTAMRCKTWPSALKEKKSNQIFLENRKEHVERILKPLRDRQERVYVTAGSKAESTARKNPHEEAGIEP